MTSVDVDYSCPSSLKKEISRLQKKRKALLRAKGYNEISFQGSKYNLDNLYPVFEEMLNASHRFDSLCEYPLYYVYAHCDPRIKLDVRNDIRAYILATKFNMTHQPVYVGKGQGNRFLDFVRDGAHRKIRANIRKEGKDLLAIKILEGVDESQALLLEGKLIDILGCRSLSSQGWLTNLDEGYNKDERRKSYGDNILINKLLRKYAFIK